MRGDPDLDMSIDPQPLNTKPRRVRAADHRPECHFGRDAECDCHKAMTDPPVPAGDVVCEHGTPMDVHCCNCHSGFLFDIDSCVCEFDGVEGGSVYPYFPTWRDRLRAWFKAATASREDHRHE